MAMGGPAPEPGAPGAGDEAFPGFAFEARWSAWHGPGGEEVRIHVGEEGIHAASRLTLAESRDRVVRLAYALVVDPDWRTRSVEVRDLDTRDHLRLEADGDGGWTDAAGQEMPRLRGCVDVDIRGAPFTNALPINRLGLEVGRTAVARVVYVDFPGLSAVPAEHHYTKLHEDDRGARYRLQDPDSGFDATLDVDPQGLVVSYPRVARRVA